MVLNKGMSSLLGYIACAVVPISLAVATYFMVPQTAWLPCTVSIMMLAYLVTHMAVGVYDVCVTAIFVCGMRNPMAVPDELREVLKMFKGDEYPQYAEGGEREMQ